MGGGSIFSTASQSPGSLQAIAAALVPSGLGLTPVAFFPPTAAQSLPAVSVIFLEAPLAGRKKRNTRDSYFTRYKKGGFIDDRFNIDCIPLQISLLQYFII